MLIIAANPMTITALPTIGRATLAAMAAAAVAAMSTHATMTPATMRTGTTKTPAMMPPKILKTMLLGSGSTLRCGERELGGSSPPLSFRM